MEDQKTNLLRRELKMNLLVDFYLISFNNYGLIEYKVNLY